MRNSLKTAAAALIAVAVCGALNVRGQDRVAWRELPHVQVVDFFHMFAVRQRDPDLARGDAFGRALEQHADGFLLQVIARAEHQQRHSQVPPRRSERRGLLTGFEGSGRR